MYMYCMFLKYFVHRFDFQYGIEFLIFRDKNFLLPHIYNEVSLETLASGSNERVTRYEHVHLYGEKRWT